MTVDLDITFAAQIVLFVLLFLVLRPLLFAPLVRLFEERERRMSGAREDARRMEEEADEAHSTYQAKIEAARRVSAEERDRLRAEGLKREQQILATVRAETDALVHQGKARIAAQGSALRAELDVTASALAREMASQVLGREVQP